MYSPLIIQVGAFEMYVYLESIPVYLSFGSSAVTWRRLVVFR